jgi:hypothetical protein
MPLRSFRTPEGAQCDVWEVTGATLPGGHGTRRVRERRGQDVLRYRGPERRKGERRKGAASGVTLLPPEYASGWLAFQCGGEKRRLVPLPVDWESYSEERLAELWLRARPIEARGVSGPM